MRPVRTADNLTTFLEPFGHLGPVMGLIYLFTLHTANK